MIVLYWIGCVGGAGIVISAAWWCYRSMRRAFREDVLDELYYDKDTERMMRRR